MKLAKYSEVPVALRGWAISLTVSQRIRDFIALRDPTEVMSPEQRIEKAREQAWMDLEIPEDAGESKVMGPEWIYLLVYRADGDMICNLCGKSYWKHPRHPIANETMLCNGDLVHLLTWHPRLPRLFPSPGLGRPQAILRLRYERY